MRARSVFVVLGLLAGLSGCATINVRSETAPGAELHRYQRYAWIPPSEPESIPEQHSRELLTSSLATHGFFPAGASGEADFLISFHVLQERKATVTDWGAGLNHMEPRLASVTHGTLIVDFIDARTYKVFWHGTTTGFLADRDVVRPRRLGVAVERLIATYPHRSL